MLSRTALGVVLALSAIQPLAAKEYDFSSGDDVGKTYTGDVPTGDTWNLNDDGVHLAYPLNIDNESSAFTLDMNGNGHTLTLNDSGFSGGINAESTNLVTLNLSDIIIAGGTKTAASTEGGAVSTQGALRINVTGPVEFKDNSVKGNSGGVSGGAIFAMGDIVFGGKNEAKGDLKFENNKTSQGGGGAVASADGDISFNNAGSVTFSSNESEHSDAGAIDGRSGSVAFGEKTTDVILENNMADGSGGAIYSLDTVEFAGSGHVRISGNIASYGSGGAITASGDVLFDNHGAVTITDNSAAGDGGAIATSEKGAKVAFGKTTTDVIIANNRSDHLGGAISANGDVRFENSGSVTITGNSSGWSLNPYFDDKDYAGISGGAVAGVNILFNNAGSTRIAGNITQGNGGAIYAGELLVWQQIGSLTVDSPVETVMFENNHAEKRGGAIWSSGDVSLSTVSGSITFRGNTAGERANAIYLDNTVIEDDAGQVIPNPAKLTLNAGADPSTNAAPGEGEITFFDPIENNAANGLVSVAKTGNGLLSFDGVDYTDVNDRWSKIYGSTELQNGTFEVANGAVYGALAADVEQTAPSTFTSAAGTMVQGGVTGEIRADTVTLNGDLSIAGRQPDKRGTFTITSNNLTFGGGTIHFNSYLNDGATQNTDLLVLNLDGSTVNGKALFAVTNIGGPGAYTPGNGIQLIQTNNGITPEDTFALATGSVIGGAYVYRLHRGAVDGDTANANNWYLRSVYTPPEPPAPPGPEPEPPAPPAPEIQPGVAVSAALTPLAMDYGYAMLDTLHERIGETYLQPLAPVTEERIVWCKDARRKYRCTVKTPVAATDGNRWASSGWARVIGERGLHQPDNFMRRGPNYDFTLGGIQAGLDLFAHQQQDGTLDKAGLYAAYGQISSTVKGQGNAKAGNVDMDAYTIGAYWSHHAPQGWYTDAVLQGTWYSTDADTVIGQKIEPDGFGILGSLEGGYAFKFGSGWALEPQAQIVYQNVSFDKTSDNLYARYTFSGGESLRGRLGARLAKSWALSEGATPRFLTGWLRANVWHEFMGDTETTATDLYGYGAFTLPSSLGGTWGEFGAGLTAQLTEQISLFASGAYQHSLDNTGNQSWDGKLGMTAKW